jgi:hypothetical protein
LLIRHFVSAMGFLTSSSSRMKEWSATPGSIKREVGATENRQEWSRIRTRSRVWPPS